MRRTVFFTCALLLTACSSEQDPAGGGSTVDAGADGSMETSVPDAPLETSTEASVDAAPDAPVPDAPLEAASDVANDVGPVDSCDEIGSKSCFANNECETDRRCENVGTETLPVACCVPGLRGSGEAGTACDDENDCVSGVCISGNGPFLCSDTCDTEADCPDGMKDCTPIAFSGSDDMWCLPTD